MTAVIKTERLTKAYGDHIVFHKVTRGAAA